MLVARCNAIIYELRALRETFPDLPIVSDLDLSGLFSTSALEDHYGKVMRMLHSFEQERHRPMSSAKQRDNARQRAKWTGSFFGYC